VDRWKSVRRADRLFEIIQFMRRKELTRARDLSDALEREQERGQQHSPRARRTIRFCRLPKVMISRHSRERAGRAQHQ
jgi:predicted DNA-binding transcriptional regulator YafY